MVAVAFCTLGVKDMIDVGRQIQGWAPSLISSNTGMVVIIFTSGL